MPLLIYDLFHGLRTPREEIAFTARPKIQSQSQIFRYGGRIFCLPHRPNFSDIFDLCLHWVSVVRGYTEFGNIDLIFRWQFCVQWNSLVIKGLNNFYCLLGSIIEEIAFRNGHFLLFPKTIYLIMFQKCSWVLK